MTSRPSAAAPILVVLAVVLVIYAAAYVALDSRRDRHIG